MPVQLIEKKKSLTEKQFPKLMISTVTNGIYLILGINSNAGPRVKFRGMRLGFASGGPLNAKPGDNLIPEYQEDWCASNFLDYDETIELSNTLL